MDTPEFGVLILVESLAEAEIKAKALREILTGYEVRVVPWSSLEVEKDESYQEKSPKRSVALETRMPHLPLPQPMGFQISYVMTTISVWRQSRGQKRARLIKTYTLGDILAVPLSFYRNRKHSERWLPPLVEYLASIGYQLKEGEGDA